MPCGGWAPSGAPTLERDQATLRPACASPAVNNHQAVTTGWFPFAGSPRPHSGASLASRRSVVIGLVVTLAQTVALAVAADVTRTVALRTQTVTSLVDVAVGVFLLLAVLRSDRAPDDRHPLGYGRERFFWSFVAAAGIFLGGVGAAGAETFRSVLHPVPASHFLVGYLVLSIVIVLDVVALLAGLAPLLRRSRQRDLSLTRFLWTGTDPAVTTVFVSSAAGLVGALLAMVGIAVREITGWASIDIVASAMIALVLLITSALLLHTSRELLTGRGVAPDMIEAMRNVIESMPGVVEATDLFAIVVGPASLILAGDVVFDDDLDVNDLEVTIVEAAAALRARWPSITYLYLTPVSEHRTRRQGGASTRVG